ncbi:subtilisin family serine protease/uncharacterized protein with beta-barrel porin domain [Methylobacterium sp. BE186]|nr:subtilisin family serine protease/uncharacterized protein with beta-barrel porin domain [Methylobacterium sp. BE186]
MLAGRASSSRRVRAALLVSAALAGADPARAQTAPDLTTFPYFQPRTPPATEQDPYGFAFRQPTLAAGTPQGTVLEFNANWGNRAVGQAAALNATARPDGAPVAGGLTGQGVTVAVIDSGIDATFRTGNPAEGFASTHPEFAGRIDARSRAFPRDQDPTLGIIDVDGHGTHVAGTIGAARDGVGMMGVAPDVNLVVLKGIGAEREGAFDSDRALDYAAGLADVRVINGSYGPTIAARARIWRTGDLGREYEAASKALAAGKILVYANGNDATNAPATAGNPTGVALFPYIRPENRSRGVYDDGGRSYDFSALGRLPGSIVAVANVGADLTIAPSSNRCGVSARWCVSAPGGGNSSGAEGILSTYPRSVRTDVVGPNAEAVYHYTAGTSMAAPHVSGVLAVLFQAFPTYSSLDIVRLLFGTAQDLGARGTDEIYGRGLVRLDLALSKAQIDPEADQTLVTLGPGEARYWSAPVAAKGEITVTGAGSAEGTGSKVEVAGRTTLRGALRAQNVEIEVDGTLTTPRLTIARDAALSGEGDIFGTVEVKGLLSPGSGNSGDLVVHGNLTLDPGATFQAIVDGADAAEAGLGYSVAVVSGAGHAFTAAGRLVFDMFGIPAGSVVAPIGTRFPVVMVEEGARILGRFASVEVTSETGATGLPAASRIDLLYRPDAILGAVTPAAYGGLEANGVPLSARQRAVGAALDRARGAPGDAMSERALALFDPLFGRAAADLPRVFDALSGAGSGAVAQAAVEDARRLTGLVGQRLASLRSGTASVQGGFAPSLATAATGLGTGGLYLSPIATLPTRFSALDGGLPGAPAVGSGVWGLGFGNALRIGADAAGPGLRAQGGGVMLGADRAVDTDLLVGAAFGYARSGVSASRRRASAARPTPISARPISASSGAASSSTRAPAVPTRISTRAAASSPSARRSRRAGARKGSAPSPRWRRATGSSSRRRPGFSG